MVIFHSYVSLPGGNTHTHIFELQISEKLQADLQACVSPVHSIYVAGACHDTYVILWGTLGPCLVGGLEHDFLFRNMFFLTFHIYIYIGNNHPNWLIIWLIFFRGVGIPPTSFCFDCWFVQETNPIQAWISNLRKETQNYWCLCAIHQNPTVLVNPTHEPEHLCLAIDGSSLVVSLSWCFICPFESESIWYIHICWLVVWNILYFSILGIIIPTN